MTTAPCDVISPGLHPGYRPVRNPHVGLPNTKYVVYSN
jgi:hypothetical protein